MIPWDDIGRIYMQNMSSDGLLTTLQEKPYMQYFLGMKKFHRELLFDASMMVHFCQRFPVNEVMKINEFVCTRK